MKYCMILSVLLLTFSVSAEKKLPEIAQKYIDAYKEIAISEMHRTGIPASIKLAQGLLESNWGRSDLATDANNHFGIKCGNSWLGESFYKKDDDYHNGKLISSCFRKYINATQSYIDHSDFLSKPRYQNLYEHPTTDYKSWAKGLKRAGYASDPKYPKKLIEIIEKYDLHHFDLEVEGFKNVYANTDSEGHKSNSSQGQNQYDPEERYTNQAMQTIEITASSTELSKKTKEALEIHIVGKEEMMEDIAKRYDIALFKLYARNRMPKGSQPLAGEIIHLKDKIRLKDRPKFIRFPKRTEDGSEFLFAVDQP